MNKGIKKVLKIIIIILLFIILVEASRILWGLFNSSVKENNNFQADELEEDNEIAQKNPDELLFVFAGVDSTGENLGTRTDTLMLVLLNKVNKTIDIISIPRDSRVYVNGSLDKINSSHSYGAMPLTIKTLRDFFNIDLDYYAEMSFQAVKDAVDSMGGVDIYVDQRVADAMDMNEGMHTFDGEKALWYVRFRKGYSNADLGRVQTQQDFIVQFIKQVLKPKNLLKIPKIYAKTSADIDTNIPLSTLFSFAWSFRNISDANINTYTINGEAEIIDDVSYFIPYEESVVELRNTILYNYIKE